MILSNVNIGTGPSAGDGDPLRSAFSTINNNFQTITNNVNALSNSVTSVAGRAGNVILTVNDIIGINTYASNTVLVLSNIGMRGYVDATVAANISAIVGGAPGALDTLNELASALNDDFNFAANVVNIISNTNSNIVIANTTMKSYVDGQILAANSAVSSGGNVGPTIPSTVKGFISLVGDRPNDQDNVWFEAVTVHGGYAYVVGGDYYISDSSGATKVYKFDLTTGAQVWVKQITSGRGAQFDFSFADSVATLTGVSQGGVGYSAGDTLFFNGNNWEANYTLNRLTVTVDSVDSNGAVVTASIVPGYNVVGIAGTSTDKSADNDAAYGDPATIAYNADTDQLTVVSEYQSGLGDDVDSDWTWFNIYTLNATTGLLAAVTTTVSDTADVYPNSVKIKDGNVAIVGEKYGEYLELGALNILRTGVGYFDILKSNLDPEHYPGAPFSYYGDFWIQGTGISNMENIDNINNINLYENVSPTVRQGSGALFQITDNSNTTYSVTVITAGGINYLPGHKIKVLGSVIGGVDVTNDAIITVTTANAGAITAATVTGTAAVGEIVTTTFTQGVDYTSFGLANYVGGGATTLSFSGGSINFPNTSNKDALLALPADTLLTIEVESVTYTFTMSTTWVELGTDTDNWNVNGISTYPLDPTVMGKTVSLVSFDTIGSISYTAVTGTNFETGSGSLFIIGVDPTIGTCSNSGQTSFGSKYVVGDVLTVPGTVFANGTSPTNDITFTVSDLFGAGSITGILNNAISGTAPTDALRINVNGLNFTTVDGAWTMKQNLGAEAFIWTNNFSNSIGGPSGDRFYDVCWSGDGASLYAVGRGVYEVIYNQAIVVKFNATTGAVVWSQDIKFDEAGTEDREARAVVEVPGSTDIIVAGAWYNNEYGDAQLILTRLTSAGVAVWQKVYQGEHGINYEMNLSASGNAVVLSLQQNTYNNNGLGYFVINPATGAVITHRVLSADGNSNYNEYNTPTPQFAAVTADSIVFAGYTYVPTDNYYNALLVKLPLDGYKDIAVEQRISLGEHILTRHEWTPVTVTPAFESFTVTEHLGTLNSGTSGKSFETVDPQGQLQVWPFTITDDAAGYLEFGDGSKQAFATDIIPQIPAANDYYLTTQDSGKHIYFEDESGRVYIPHWSDVNLPVGFTFTIVNTTGNNCYVDAMSSNVAPFDIANFRLAGRDIQTGYIGIPDNGAGSMVTFLKIKTGYIMDNSDGPGQYRDQWIVSGPGDVFNAD